MNKSVISEFAAALHGRLVTPEDSDYDSARSVWNGMIDRRPRMIAQCADTADVVASVKFAREYDLPMSVRGGGHGVAGKAVCDEGVLIDLSPMRAVKVDPKARIARAEPGATLADLDRETQAHGLATTGGLVSETGIAGLTLGGGIGYLARRFGLTLDNLVAADVVTADGRQVRASEKENADLFWGLRGGGGNFGIVTAFEYRLHEVGPNVMVAQVFYPFDHAERVLNHYRDLMAKAPDELACYALVAHVPPAEPFPEEFHGRTSIALVACHTGNAGEAQKLLNPLKELGKPILAMVGEMPYAQLQQSFDAGMPHGARYYWKAHYLDELSDDAIKRFISLSEPLPGELSLVGFEPLGGAISRVDPSATAFAHRDAKFALGIWAGWTDPADDEKIKSWTRDFHKAFVPYSTGGVYVNYLDQDDDERVNAAFGDSYARLRDIKAKWDPENFFCLNQNIRPRK